MPMTQISSKDSASAVGNADRTLAIMHLEDNVTTVTGVSPRRAKALKSMGVVTVKDLVTLFPRRYIDLSKVESIRSASIGEVVPFTGAFMR